MQGGDYFAPDSTEILIRTTATRRGSLLDRLLYRLHSTFAHWHAVAFERHWHAATRASRRLSLRALHNIELARADPNRPA